MEGEGGEVEISLAKRTFPQYRHFLGGPLAQLAEQLTLNQRAAGSIPARPTNKIKHLS